MGKSKVTSRKRIMAHGLAALVSLGVTLWLVFDPIGVEGVWATVAAIVWVLLARSFAQDTVDLMIRRGREIDRIEADRREAAGEVS